MRAVLALLLLLAAAPAGAQWLKVDEADNAVHFIDSATISRTGQMRRVWVTQYWKQSYPEEVKSRRAFLEYDCAGARFRYLSVSEYSAPLAGGQYVLSQRNVPEKPGQVPAAVPAATVQRMVCAP
jgi:hypothetical protein